MPKGTYHHLDPDGTVVGVEVFSCAPGPSGWRWVSQTSDLDGRPLSRVDLTVDDRWRQLRVQVTAGGWVVRGGLTGREVVWVRHPEDASRAPAAADVVEQQAPAIGFTGISPAFIVATARLLGLAADGRRTAKLLRVTEPSCLALPVDEGWALVDVTTHEHPDHDPLTVERYEVIDLATAERRVVHLAGDVVVDATGLELVALESPPTTFAAASLDPD
ncbi:MAG TPA: hypothetical protein VNB94_09160 [Mycobacteriales bacterium]|nr:hypothetical protein [Mycobacteriales bacterium]